MISASLISSVAGVKMPGPGSIYVKQTLNFKRPVYLDDTVTARCKVLSIRPEKKLVQMETLVFNQENQCVIEGDALVLVEEDKIEKK